MSRKSSSITFFNVLILVLVEDGLREKKKKAFLDYYNEVLILVLVEDGLREKKKKAFLDY